MQEIMLHVEFKGNGRFSTTSVTIEKLPLFQGDLMIIYSINLQQELSILYLLDIVFERKRDSFHYL